MITVFLCVASTWLVGLVGTRKADARSTSHVRSNAAGEPAPFRVELRSSLHRQVREEPSVQGHSFPKRPEQTLGVALRMRRGRKLEYKFQSARFQARMFEREGGHVSGQ
jgi:hypothetical protein